MNSKPSREWLRTMAEAEDQYSSVAAGVPDDPLCAICSMPVMVHSNEAFWGFEWGEVWLHYNCTDEVYGAMQRIRHARAP